MGQYLKENVSSCEGFPQIEDISACLVENKRTIATEKISCCGQEAIRLVPGKFDFGQEKGQVILVRGKVGTQEDVILDMSVAEVGQGQSLEMRRPSNCKVKFA